MRTKVALTAVVCMSIWHATNGLTSAQDLPQSQTDQVITALTAATKADDIPLRAAIFTSLSEFLDEKPELVSIFIEAVDDPSDRVRAAVLNSLAEMTSPPAEALEIVIRRGAEFKRYKAIEERLMDSAPATAVPLFIEELRTEAPQALKLNIIEILTQLRAGSAEALPVLLELLTDEEEDRMVRIYAASAATVIAKAVDNAAEGNAAEGNEQIGEQAEQWESYAKAAQAMITSRDGNRDGKLSKDEAPTLFNLPHASFDADEDGFIVKPEIVSTLRRQLQIGGR